jgi:hypothetical protein
MAKTEKPDADSGVIDLQPDSVVTPQAAAPPTTPTDTDSGRAVTWSASEFVAHEKSTGWYVSLGVGALLVAGLAFVITRDFVSVGVVIISALILGVYGARQPRQLDYRLNNRGLSIGPKHYDYNEFRSFMIMPEGAFSSIVFMPHKRFAPSLTIYYPPDDEQAIVGILDNQLPSEEGKRDAIDHLLHRIRF